MESFKIAQNIQQAVESFERKMVVADGLMDLVEEVWKLGVTRRRGTSPMTSLEYIWIMEALEWGHGRKMFCLVDPGLGSKVMLSESAHKLPAGIIEERIRRGDEMAMFRGARGFEHVEQYCLST